MAVNGETKQGLTSAAQQLNLQTLIQNLAGGGVIIFAISSGDANHTEINLFTFKYEK